MARRLAPMSGSRLLGGAALLGAAALYGSFGVLIRELEHLFGDSTQVVVRFSVAAAVSAGILLFWGNRAAVTSLTRRELYAALGLAVAFSADVVCFTVAVNRATIATSVSLLYAGGIVTSLVIAAVWFDERITGLKAMAIVVAMAGLAMYGGSFAGFGFGVVMALAAGICEGVCNGLRRTVRGADRSAVITIQYAGGAVFALFVAVVSNEHLIRAKNPGFTGIAWPIAVAVAFGFCLVALGYLLLYGFAQLELNVAAIVLATEIGFAMAFGVLFFGEIPSLAEVLGGLLIFAAATLAVMERPERAVVPIPNTVDESS